MELTEAIDRLTEKIGELIALLKEKDKKHYPEYKNEASSATGEIEAKEMLKGNDL